MKATVKRIKKRTAEIEVGHTYFLSSFYEQERCDGEGVGQVHQDQ